MNEMGLKKIKELGADMNDLRLDLFGIFLN